MMASGRSARLPATPQPVPLNQNPRHMDVPLNNDIAQYANNNHLINNSNCNSNSLNSGNGASVPGDGLTPFSSEFVTTTSQVLDSLSERERLMIINVLKRDDSVRQRDAARIMLLRAELQNLRRKGALKVDAASLDRPLIFESHRTCARCQCELGRIINRGAPCRCCRLRVCKACREFTNRTTDWVCVVCHKQIEIQTASGEWMNEFSKSRRESEAEGMKKSIRRSWTISSPQNDRIPQPRNGAEYRNYSSLPPGPEATDYPSLARHHPSNNHYNSYESNPEEYIEPVVNPQQQRRVLRQSTMPNPEVNQYNSNNNLMPPGSPKQQISPQYSPYNTDNEDNEMPNNPMPIRYGIRRQSTLPCPPNFQSSTSPNRMYSRSPERNEGDAPRMPPFLRQSTFPSNTSDPLFQQPHHQRPKLLPTSPNRHPFNKSPEMAEADSNNPMKRYQMMRQNTLPNPDQHVKLLPTSPPKKLSPQQYLKRSPEFIRQNTLPNPEGMNTLSIPQHKFLPISPRQKQSFLFPQPHQQQQNPRPFLSQQNFPTMNDEAAVTQSSSPVESTGHREHSKMIKVRSHSNEEYGMNRALEGRRLLPEIPTNRSPRLVRQEHVKEEVSRQNSEQKSPIKRTFYEAKQNLIEYENTYQAQGEYQNEPRRTYLESDETSYVDRGYDSYNHEEVKATTAHLNVRVPAHQIRSTESFLNDSSPEYFHPEEYIRAVKKDRTRRRRSKEMIETELVMSSNDEEPAKRKPETMRSISEDTPSNRQVKPVTRRSLSHPEREKEVLRRTESTKAPTPKPLTDFFDKQKKEKLSKLPSPRRKNYKSLDLPEHNTTSPTTMFPKVALQKRDSKSLEAVMRSALLTEKLKNALQDNKSQSMDEGIFNEKDEKKTDDHNHNQQKSTLGEAEIQNAVEAAAVIFKKVVIQRRNAKKAAEEEELPVSPEVAASPTTSTKNVVGPASPTSRGSASSDPWPTQSDDDIDRLVALHRNRNSLSSLGVRSDSMASVYSGAGEGRYGNVTVKGNIEFGMQYNYKQNALEVHIVQCKDLAAVDTKRNRSDPYVKLYLLPDKSKGGKRKTKVKKHTLNPFFDEVLKFQMSLNSLESRTLWLSVWHSDMFGRNDFLGEVTINLQGRVFDNPQPQWYLLQERSENFDEPPAYKGDIIVALKFVPPESAQGTSGGNLNLRKFSKSSSSSKNATKGELHVLVKEAKNLTPVKANGSCDAFCKSYLLPDKNRNSKRKTEVAKRTSSPAWNHTIVYEDVSLQDLSERALELTVWDHDRLASNEFLGGVRFSLGTGKHYGKSVEWMDATGKELSLWQSMINRPNFWVEGSVVLRSSLENSRLSPPS